jgi:hypothetical protein
LSLKIEILNPLPGGMKFTSSERARNFVRRGLAFFNGGRLCFYQSTQDARSEDAEFMRNRGGMLFWNGARSKFVDGRDVAMYPPGCNVAFKPPYWIKGAENITARATPKTPSLEAYDKA